jgi:hypothetical protein
MRYEWLANSRFVAAMIFFSLTLAIVGNALFLQPSPHPAPLFFTRPAAVPDSSQTVPVPIARQRGDARSGSAASANQPKARPGIDSQPAAEPERRADPIVLAIQQALADAAYGPVSIDGIAGQQTADAIRRFQLDQGLAVTGEIDDRLITRLISVGAMAQR